MMYLLRIMGLLGVAVVLASCGSPSGPDSSETEHSTTSTQNEQRSPSFTLQGSLERVNTDTDYSIRGRATPIDGSKSTSHSPSYRLTLGDINCLDGATCLEPSKDQ
jgi:hypothetical protein